MGLREYSLHVADYWGTTDWGTTDESVIQSMIYDKNRDLNSAGVISYKPYLTQPDPATPVH